MRIKRLLLIAISALPSRAAAHKKPQVKKDDNPGNLYVEGIAFMKKKQYDKAITSFGKVRENFPFDPIALVAQIKQADAQFEKRHMRWPRPSTKILSTVTPKTRMPRMR